MRIFNFFFSSLSKNYFYFLFLEIFFNYQEYGFQIFLLAFISWQKLFLIPLFFFSIIEKSTFSNVWCEFLIWFSSFFSYEELFLFSSSIIFHNYKSVNFSSSLSSAHIFMFFSFVSWKELILIIFSFELKEIWILLKVWTTH